MNISSNIEIIFRPLSGAWPKDGKMTYDNCRFRAAHSVTMRELKYELFRINADRVVIELDLQERDIRLDGLLRASARPESPRVRVSFEHPDVGPLQYPCNTYYDRQDNLRAIVQTLKAQRAMDRYGATRQNQQYTGWQQLPPGGGSVMQTAMTVERAAAFINLHAGSPTIDEDLVRVADNVRMAYRLAAARLHPDRGGDAYDFQRLSRVLRPIHGQP